MNVKQIICIMALLCIPAALAAEEHQGRRLYLYGDSAESLGRGGTGASAFGTDLFYLNPASIGRMERVGVGMQYGTLDGSFYNPDLTLAIPSTYGVFGLGLRYLNLPSTEDFGTAYSFQFGHAREFTDWLAMGLSLNFVAAQTRHNLYYAGISVGAIFSLKGTAHSSGFCLYEPKIGISINGGIPVGTNNIAVNFNSFTFGYSFQFVRVTNFTLAFFNDITLFEGDRHSPYGTPVDFPLKFGMEGTLFDHYIIRIGTVYPPAYDYGDFSLGLGYVFDTRLVGGSLNYALNYYRNREVIHHVSLRLEFGKTDRAAPVTDVAPDQKYFSPNHDGEQDYVLFKLGVRDESRISGWRLTVTDDAGRVVKEFRMSDRDLSRNLTFTGFFRRIFQKKESLVVPGSVMWDGTDRDGNVLRDGKYAWSFTAWDERDNIAAGKSGVVVIDNTAPAIVSGASDTLFSPNNDRQKDVFVIAQNVTTEADDQWIASMTDAQGKAVRTWRWTGPEVPRFLQWDGKDDNGLEVPEGLYRYKVKCRDQAGNRARAEINEIALYRQYEITDVSLSAEYFSFLKGEGVNIFPVISQSKGLEEWKVLISDPKGKPVREFSGGKEFQRLIKWDCTDEKGARLPDGEYFVKIQTRFKSGNTPESFPRRFIVDSTPPELQVTHTPQLFSPDGDGENDVLVIRTGVREFLPVTKWKISIHAPSGELFKCFEGTGDVPAEIRWDGMSDKKDIVESAADYTITLEAVDRAGNAGVSPGDKLAVDILVIVTERGLKMRISNIEFGFGSSYLTKKGYTILDRVGDILQKYGRYNVLIEGHTDDIGEEDFNLKLSETRAKSVQEYLVKRGVAEARLSFIGMGETVALYPNTNDENRRRNRRVEFLLIKKEQEPAPAQAPDATPAPAAQPGPAGE